VAGRRNRRRSGFKLFIVRVGEGVYIRRMSLSVLDIEAGGPLMRFTDVRHKDDENPASFYCHQGIR